MTATTLYSTETKHIIICLFFVPQHCSSQYKTHTGLFFVATARFLTVHKHRPVFSLSLQHSSPLYRKKFFVNTTLFFRIIFSLLLQHCSSFYRNTEQSFLCYYSTELHYTETQNNLFFVTTVLVLTIQKHGTIFSLLLHHCSLLYRNTEQSFLCYYTTVRYFTETQNNLFFVTTPLFVTI